MRRGYTVEDQTGKTFGLLTITGDSGARNHSGSILWRCSCECGGVTDVALWFLRKGVTKSCGCLQRQKAKTLCESRAKHSEGRRGGHSQEYKAWRYLKDRIARDPDYAGVYLEPEWATSYEKFLEGVGRKPSAPGRWTLDRIDNALGYRKGNVRWADDIQQANNRTNNLRIKYRGDEDTLANWSRRLGFSYSAVHGRLSRGMSVEEAFTKPLRGWSPGRPRIDILKD